MIYKNIFWYICCFILLLLPFLSVAQSDCYNLTKSFKSYNQAVFEVKNSKFKSVDHLNTARSSFINSAHYYSCDGMTGYMIISLNNKEYIHSGLPIKIWLSFKNSESLGSFYSKNIRYRYRLTLQE